MLTLLSLGLSTLVSEDAACVAAAVLIAHGAATPVAAIGACTLGIFVGDLGLWALGCLGEAWLGRIGCLGRLAVRVRAHPVAQSAIRNVRTAIVTSRFLPGTRLPVYVAAGMAGVPFRTFGGWSLMACAIWTPAVVMGAGRLGRLAELSAPSVGVTPLVLQLLGALMVLPLLALVRTATARASRQRLAARLARWRRWEFWPMWLFYPPVALWILWLTIRHRGVTMTAANPGMPDGGTVGESKFDILASLPSQTIIPSLRLAPEVTAARLARLRDDVSRRNWTLPLVLKPDVGQRGVGVRLARSWDDIRVYLEAMPGAVLVQPYDPGPCEAGVFYVRQPGASRGRIFSVTDKVFPFVVGDGSSTLEALIWRHPRYRMQAATFLQRLGLRAAYIPLNDERVPLAIAGNHAQGTLFRDGRDLITPALEAAIDGIARQVPGFFIGRFDIRYRDVDQFRRGGGFAIVELNGATAESTDIYDPDASLLNAYRTLFEQWSLVFSIGAENRRRGATITSPRRLRQLLLAHLTTRQPIPLSD